MLPGDKLAGPDDDCKAGQHGQNSDDQEVGNDRKGGLGASWLGPLVRTDGTNQQAI